VVPRVAVHVGLGQRAVPTPPVLLGYRHASALRFTSAEPG